MAGSTEILMIILVHFGRLKGHVEPNSLSNDDLVKSSLMDTEQLIKMFKYPAKVMDYF